MNSDQVVKIGDILNFTIGSIFPSNRLNQAFLRTNLPTPTMVFLLIIVTVCGGTKLKAQALNNEPSETGQLQVGAERIDLYRPLLAGKRVGLVVNQSSLVKGQHLVDYFLQNHIEVTAIFSPEHGYKGNHSAGKKIESSNDKNTGITIFSLYGKNKQPTKTQLSNIDILVFDIQDVGVRFYTYISTMHYVMKAASESGIPLIILDRPNPNGRWVDGPILEQEYRSFVGMHPIPLLHGMTVAELGLMIKGEGWLNDSNINQWKKTNKSSKYLPIDATGKNKKYSALPNAESVHQLELEIIPMDGYSRAKIYNLPIRPSPNLPNAKSIAWYPSLAFFEATPVSIGRGTEHPFQVIGHNQISIGNFEFKPRVIKGVSDHPKLQGLIAKGVDLRNIEPNGLTLKPLITWFNAFNANNEAFFTRKKFFDQLAGSSKLREKILSGLSEEAIKASWRPDLKRFRLMRKPYLIYSDSEITTVLATKEN